MCNLIREVLQLLYQMTILIEFLMNIKLIIIEEHTQNAKFIKSQAKVLTNYQSKSCLYFSCNSHFQHQIIKFVNHYFYSMIEQSQHHRYEGSNRSRKEQGFIELRIITEPNTPRARFRHQTFTYKGKMFVQGGTSIPMSDMVDEPSDLYCYDSERREGERWERIKSKWANGKPQGDVLSGHTSALSGSKWYVFGGSTDEGKQNGQLLRLNLQSMQWVRCQQKGDVPSARSCAFLISLERNWLVLYGGVSTTDTDIYNTFHFYNSDTRNWVKCVGPYTFQIYPRLEPALAMAHQRLFLFGGAYRNLSNEEKCLADFYQITLAPPSKNVPPKAAIKRLQSSQTPEPRSGHSLICIKQNFLLLIGGQTISESKEGYKSDEIKIAESMWMYSIQGQFWSKLQIKSINCHFKFSSLFSAASQDDNKILLFGGIVSYNNVLNDLVELNLSPLLFNSKGGVCKSCTESKQIKSNVRYISSTIIQEICSNIMFPFSAFGLLVDNSMNNYASFLKITYLAYNGHCRPKMIKFEDDAKINWSDDEFLSSILNFNGQSYVPSGMQKKLKANLQRDNTRRQYGCNMKIGSLRLGQSFLFVSHNEQECQLRVFLMEKVENKKNISDRFILYFYSYKCQEKRLVDDSMENTRDFIIDRYGDLIEPIMYTKKSRNLLVILNPRVQDNRSLDLNKEQELRADFETNNIYFGSHQKRKQLEKSGLHIHESIDISLRAYLTCLYLKNQTMKITLSVKDSSNHQIEIHTQMFLQKVDRLCKQKHILQINSVLELDLKISELYYLNDLKKKLGFFNNGLLIYHRNRLITRYKYPLGELITRKGYKYSEHNNLIRLFGLIQLPDAIPINIFKTSYMHHIMVNKLFSRLKFISKIFKKRLLQIGLNANKRVAPTKLNEEEVQQQRQQLKVVKSTSKEKIAKISTSKDVIVYNKRQSTRIKNECDWKNRFIEFLIDPTQRNAKQMESLHKFLLTSPGQKHTDSQFQKYLTRKGLNKTKAENNIIFDQSSSRRNRNFNEQVHQQHENINSSKNGEMQEEKPHSSEQNGSHKEEQIAQEPIQQACMVEQLSLHEFKDKQNEQIHNEPIDQMVEEVESRNQAIQNEEDKMIMQEELSPDYEHQRLEQQQLYESDSSSEQDDP